MSAVDDIAAYLAHLKTGGKHIDQIIFDELGNDGVGRTDDGVAERGTCSRGPRRPMAEYVYGTDGREGHWLTGEEIVRCRDCKFYTPESMTREDRGFGVYENVWEPGACFNPSRCSSTWDHIKEQMVPVGIDTDPNGYCAWGERKEVEE